MSPFPAGWLHFAFRTAAPLLACMAVLFALVATPLFRAADTPPTKVKHRIASLDGLRGFLALAVVFHHLSIYAVFLRTNIWELPPSHFDALLGPFGVSIFFMITGYLFWGRLLRDGGHVHWRALYTGRLFRIGPLYMAAALLVLLAVFWHTGPHLLVPGRLLALQVGSWLSLGVFDGIPVNGWRWTTLLLAGVTWTVQCEWIYYFSLPVLAILARRSRWQMPGILAMLAVIVSLRLFRAGHASDMIVARCGLFLAGMLCASLHRRFRAPALPGWFSSTLLVLCCAVAFVRPQAYSVSELVGFGAAFYLVTSGCDLFGLLLTRPARRLGDISYGIYLLQGVAMAVLFWPAFLQRFALGAPLHLWTLNLLCCVLLLVMATAAHVWIERPGIALGRRIAKRWAGPKTNAHEGEARTALVL